MKRRLSPGQRTRRSLLVVSGSSVFTVVFFLLLPLIQAVTAGAKADLVIGNMGSTQLPPPPPPFEDPPEEEEQEEEEPPEEAPDQPMLDLNQLELALNSGFGEGFGGTGFAGSLAGQLGGQDLMDDLFAPTELDEPPRLREPVAQPERSPEVVRRAPGWAQVVFKVSETGRVLNIQVLDSSDHIFEKPVVDAVRQWRFDPGKKKGQAVAFRMKRRIHFPK